MILERKLTQYQNKATNSYKNLIFKMKQTKQLPVPYRQKKSKEKLKMKESNN